MAFHQAQADGICLRYPQELGSAANLTHESAIGMLGRAHTLAQNTPFTWGYIDKPSEGQLYLIFMSNDLPFPNDGTRYQDQEQRYTLPAGNGRELEILEVKFGYIPGHDQLAQRVRRRYRFIKGGNPQITLIHYSRGQAVPIIPSMAANPVRNYPLRPYNEPAVFVYGPRAGQKIYPGGMPGPANDRGGNMGMTFGNTQAMLAQQNSNMEALERRTRERDRSASMTGRAAQARVEDDDSADEGDTISVRTLALTRYKRNHEFMHHVFLHAGFSSQFEKAEDMKPPFTIFSLDDLQKRTDKIQSEIEELQAKAAARKAAKEAEELAEVSMEGLTATSVETTAPS